VFLDLVYRKNVRFAFIYCYYKIKQENMGREREREKVVGELEIK